MPVRVATRGLTMLGFLRRTPSADRLLVVSNLSWDQRRSLVEALNAAAIVARLDAAGAVEIPRRGNRVFELQQLVAAVEDWRLSDPARGQIVL